MSDEGVVEVLWLHPEQQKVDDSTAKRKVIKAGRRSGKTTYAADFSARSLLAGKRVLYAAPTKEQTDAFWSEVCRILAEPIRLKVYIKNESERYIEKPGTNQRIKAKTAWDAQSMRGDWAEKLILDEYQMMNEDAWEEVCQPMLADKNGDALFFFTPPSLVSQGRSKARDPMHASKLYRKYLGLREKDLTCIWECFHFTSWDNPFVSHEALALIVADMSPETARREIMAEDDDIQASWLVYPQFNDALRKIPRFNIPKTWPIFSGHDFGSANPAAIFISQAMETYKVDNLHGINKGDFIIFKEYAPGSRTIPQHVESFERITEGYTVYKRVGGNRTTEDEIRQGYTAHGWPITQPIVKGVNLQVERVRGLFGLNKIWIFNDLPGILSQLSSCMFRLDDTNHALNEIKDEAKYHYLACFIAGTMVTTINGDIPIEDINIGDMVLTRQGYHKVLNAGLSGYKDTITATFSDGSKLTGTPDHPVYVKGKGFVPLTCLRYCDIVLSCKTKKLYSTESLTTDTLTLNVNQTGYISSTKANISTEQFGKQLMGRYWANAISTIKTAIEQTIILPILNLCLHTTTNLCTTQGIVRKPYVNIFYGYRGLVHYGQKQKKEKQDLKLLEKNKLKIVFQLQKYVSFVTKYLKHLLVVTQNFVQIIANHLLDAKLIRILRQESVPSVDNNSQQINTVSPKLVQENAVRFIELEPSNKTQVYNLTVDAVPEYFANGILVHNCLRYIMSDFSPETNIFGKLRVKRFLL